eukprot:XP_017174466.1 PREDICTED: uncharacterized protein C1orf167 homolog isoform X7 [Mus musculus]
MHSCPQTHETKTCHRIEGKCTPKDCGCPEARVWLSLTELKRPWTNLDISLGSRGDQKMPMCQNEAQNIVTLDSQTACRKLLSESFRVWRRLSQRRQAVAKATAMRHRQLIRKSLRELHWVLWLQKTRLEAAWEQQAKALLARSFREWRHVALRQKLEQPHTQAALTFLASRGSLSLERKAAADLAWRCRCFRAWQRLAQRGAQYRRHLAHRRVRTLRVCLGQWMEMKRLQASDVTKVTQLALHWLKAGNEVLSGLAPGAAMAHCLETVTHAQQLSKGPDQCSLWEICQKLALYRTLLLWRTRFYQRQQTGVPEVGMQLAAQAYVQQTAITQCWQRLRGLLRTHRVQSQSTLFKQKLEPQTQAQGMDLGHWLRLASRGHLLLLTDTTYFWMRVSQRDPSAQPSSSGCHCLHGPSTGPLQE